MVGWAGIWSGYREIHFYSSDFVDDPPVAANVDAREQEALSRYFQAERQSRERARRTRLPLAIGNMLLSGLLVLAASRTFGGRPGARSLALQALGSNGALAVADYVLSRDLRGELVPAVVQVTRAVVKPTGQVPEQDLSASLTAAVWAGFRVQLLLILAIYILTWISLSTEAARAYLVNDEAPEEDDLDE